VPRSDKRDRYDHLSIVHMNRHPQDGRVVSNFVIQALKGDKLTIYGDGSQTRSFCFVSDLVQGLIRLMNCEPQGDQSKSSRGPATLEPKTQLSPNDIYGPVNLGNPGEFTMLELAIKIIKIVDEMRQAGQLPTPLLKEHRGEMLKDDDGEGDLIFLPLPIDDPRQRKPDITRAKYLLGWEPTRDLDSGLREMIYSFAERMANGEIAS
jgi:UDP-glucuronate decarboxylase